MVLGVMDLKRIQYSNIYSNSMKKITSGFVLFFFPKINTPKWRIGVKDAIQALLRAMLADCFTFAIQNLEAKEYVFDLNALLITGLTAGLTYISYAWLNGKPS